MVSTEAFPSLMRPAPPACLFENSNRLVSLWDMLHFKAHDFVGAFSTLGQAMASLRLGQMPSKRDVLSAQLNLDMLRGYCEALELEYSCMVIERYGAKPPLNADDICNALFDIQSRIRDELSLRLYVQVSSHLAKHYEPKSPPFGDLVFNQFGAAAEDVIEAGNCLALERSTASVFHLMRVMESGLKTLASELGIPYAPSWESYLRQIAAVLESDWKSKPADVRAKQPFYRDVAGDLQLVKMAWRNPTMHIVKNYSQDEAVRIYGCVKQFMVRLAEAGLHDAYSMA